MGALPLRRRQGLLYLNLDGRCPLERPTAELMRGGVLADEMGLARPSR